jgi:NAD(P)-dependent dehydrogenase (short-subunit alcohol dehydrogenase family)
MTDPRSVVITGASRGLGMASAVHLYQAGWQVVAAMRSPETGMARLRTATGATDDDSRLIGVQLDLDDPASVLAAAAAIQDAVGAPDAIVNNAGISAAGMVEETPMELWEKMFSTHVLGPVLLTKTLLPAMRAAGRGRIVLISSQGGVRGMPSIAAYSAAKGALERWGESMAGEVAPFGIGVTILVTGTYDTEIITDAGTSDYRDFDGPYARHHSTIDRRGRFAMTLARSPGIFAVGLGEALQDTSAFVRRPLGPDARMLLIANRILPSAGVHHMARLAMGLPRMGVMRPSRASEATGTGPELTASQKALVLATKVLPAPILQRVIGLAVRFAPTPPPPVPPAAATEEEEVRAHG